MNIVYKKINKLKHYEKNNKKHPDKQIEKIINSIKEFGFKNPVLIDKDNVIIAGHGRTIAAEKIGMAEVPCIDCSDLNAKQVKALRLMDNKSADLAEWDFDNIKFELDFLQSEGYNLDFTGFDSIEFEEQKDVDIIESEQDNQLKTKKLSDRFIIPPFSVLDTKQGIWQQRKNYWLSLGIKSEEGREEGITFGHGGNDVVSQKLTNMKGGTSIFDPVLCELAYKWFNVPNGKILDCFAGGSVRGIVAAKLGYEYFGNDLREEQIEANRINAKEVLQDSEIYPIWTCGDSLHIDTIAKGYEADLLFSCPPYADLEVYSDKKEDISNMPYKEFISIYREIIKKSCNLLKQDRFAVFVVGDVRDKKGFYQNFVSDTIQAFLDSGLLLYNEMVFVNAVGTLAIRAGRQFATGRKVGKQHQNVLVFYKGDPKNIKQNYPEIDLGYMQEEDITQ